MSNGSVNPQNASARQIAIHSQTSFDGATIQNLLIGNVPGGPSTEPPPTSPQDQDHITSSSESINNIRQPISGLIETESFLDIYAKVQSKQTYIMHCHGVHGSGKSQLVQKLAEKFPGENVGDGNSSIKWHIQCSDSGHDVTQELTKLVEEMKRKGFVTDHYSIIYNLEKGRGGELVDALLKCSAHVLIVIEDPDCNSRDLLNDLCRRLDAKSSEERHCKFHIYFTSRKKQQILAGDQIRIYQTELLTGFSRRNAVDFLNEASECATDDDAADKIYERFSGLPLGLKAARKYCRDSEITYRDYLEHVQDSEIELEENEKQAIIEEFGPTAEHVFQAMVMPFIPDDGCSNGKVTLHWKMLLCLSYFHHDCIPRFLLERCCYMLCDESTKKSRVNIKAHTGQLVTKLFNYGMCSKTTENAVVLHQVVLNAFRLRRQDLDVDSKCMHLKKAIEIFCSLVSKDLRKKGSYGRMFQLRPHLQSFLKRIGSVNDTLTDQGEICLYEALLSYLYDVTATVMCGESPVLNRECSKYFEKALNLLWKDTSHFLTNEQESRVVANGIVRLSKEKGQLLPLNFIWDYASKLSYCFDQTDLVFAKSTISALTIKDIETNFQRHDSKEKLIRLLQSVDAFLKDESYRLVFYAERLGAILHSWSRAILDADQVKLREDAKSERMSLLSRNVSIQCMASYGVPLLCEWLTVGGLISIWLQQKRVPDYLKKVSDLCHETLSAGVKETPMYENGLIMEVSPIFWEVTLLRSLVRVNTRRMESITNTQESDESDKICQKLYDLAVSNAETFSNCPSCVVYCAKYYGARKKFDRCLNCFRQYFSMIATSNHKCHFKTDCWAVYNYARALVCHPSPPADDIVVAVRKCEEVLSINSVMKESLNERLRSVLQNLQPSR